MTKAKELLYFVLSSPMLCMQSAIKKVNALCYLDSCWKGEQFSTYSSGKFYTNSAEIPGTVQNYDNLKDNFMTSFHLDV